jgi:hypothetical protein
MVRKLFTIVTVPTNRREEMAYHNNYRETEMERLQSELDAKTERLNTLDQPDRDLSLDEYRELMRLQDEIATLETLLDITYFGE